MTNSPRGVGRPAAPTPTAKHQGRDRHAGASRAGARGRRRGASARSRWPRARRAAPTARAVGQCWEPDADPQVAALVAPAGEWQDDVRRRLRCSGREDADGGAEPAGRRRAVTSRRTAAHVVSPGWRSSSTGGPISKPPACRREPRGRGSPAGVRARGSGEPRAAQRRAGPPAAAKRATAARFRRPAGSSPGEAAACGDCGPHDEVSVVDDRERAALRARLVERVRGGVMPARRRIQAAWRASTEWIASAGHEQRTALDQRRLALVGGDGEVLEGDRGLAEAVGSSVAPRKSKRGRLTAREPSTLRSGFTCARSCAPTTRACSARPPDRLPSRSTSL